MCVFTSSCMLSLYIGIKYAAVVFMFVSFLFIFLNIHLHVCVCPCLYLPASVFLHVCMCLCVCLQHPTAQPTQWPWPPGGLASCGCPPAPAGSQGDTECEVVCLAMLQWLITVQKRPLELASWAAQQASREAGIHRLCCEGERENSEVHDVY